MRAGFRQERGVDFPPEQVGAEKLLAGIFFLKMNKRPTVFTAQTWTRTAQTWRTQTWTRGAPPGASSRPTIARGRLTTSPRPSATPSDAFAAAALPEQRARRSQAFRMVGMQELQKSKHRAIARSCRHMLTQGPRNLTVSSIVICLLALFESGSAQYCGTLTQAQICREDCGSCGAAPCCSLEVHAC
jgi:hypothetical protein